jgi:hypothetical protein
MPQLLHLNNILFPVRTGSSGILIPGIMRTSKYKTPPTMRPKMKPANPNGSKSYMKRRRFVVLIPWVK